MRCILSPLFLVAALLLSPLPASMAASPEQTGYIVVLHDSVVSPAETAREVGRQFDGEVGFIYEHALKGFSIKLPAAAAAALERNPNVKYIEKDDVRYIFDQAVPTGIERIFAHENPGIAIDGLDDYRVDVDVAVIDTGIDFQHPDLNVVGGVDCSGGSPLKRSCVSGGNDDHYHGTHVAGTIGALDNGIGVVGVAPGARLWAVKVLNSNGVGYSSWIIAGIDWVAANATTIEVANMSLGGSGYNHAEYDAIQGAVDRGVAFAVAAGNSADDAHNYSPAAFDNVLTVSALADFDGLPGGLGSPTCRNDADDTLANFSNWGTAIDIAAPGVCIRSTYPMGRGGYGTLSGTSMASPHVAGALALLASRNKPGNAEEVFNLYDQVIFAGNFNWTDDSGDGLKEPLLDVSNRELFHPVMIAGSDVGRSPINNPPIVSISSPADAASFGAGEIISFAGSASDTEDGDLTTSMIWESNLLSEPIGYGGFFSTALVEGTHTITAAVTDSVGASGSESIVITVGGGTGSMFALSVSIYKARGINYADLAWSDATSAHVDIFLNGILLTTTANSGAYTDTLGRGGGSATYQACEYQTSTCSDTVVVSW
jgi:subtilisin